MRKWIVRVVAALIFISIGIFIAEFMSDKTDKKTPVGKISPEKQEWTCSMHPSIVLDRPGKCPICYMALIKADQFKKDSAPNAVTLSESAVEMLKVQTSTVKRRAIKFSLPLVGNIEYDETKTAMISAHFNGRVKKLYLNYVGAPVKQGQSIALLFSPDVILLKRELQMMVRDYTKALGIGDEKDIAKAKEAVLSVKAKIDSWKLDPAQMLKDINVQGTTPLIPYPAPISGVVTSKNIVEGQYFKRGDTLMNIADTSVMWAVMDAYETDLPWLRYGQEVMITTEALPGQEFKGMIAYIAPEINMKTRTVRVRANVLNPDGQLRAGMFIKAKVQVEVGAGGKPTLASLVGKWISPMHPEIIKDKAGACDVCGMQLVPVSSLMSESKDNKQPMSIPASAILFTGPRSLVYVETAKSTYEPRRIVLGPRAGDYYIVKSGLKEGDKVVSNGNFQIDSTAQINRTESMMSSDASSEKTLDEENHHVINDQIIDHYFQIWRALAKDDLEKSREAAGLMANESAGDTMLKSIADRIASAKNISEARADFRVLSSGIYKSIKNSGGINLEVYKAWCPMAFNNQGAFWLQDDENVLNPYFGKAMLRCGSLKETISPRKKAD